MHPYLHAGFGVSHDREKQRKDIFSVGAGVGQAQSETKTTRIKTHSQRRDSRFNSSTRNRPEVGTDIIL